MMDARLIVSHQLNSTNIFQLSVLKVKGKYFLYHFNIQVEKNLCIEVKSEIKSSIILFDGPGFQSKVLNSSFPIYKTSTFQCVILLLKLSSLIGVLNFTSILLAIDQHLKVKNPTRFALPDKRKNLAPLVLSIGVAHGLNVNVSLYTIKQTGRFLHSPDCKFSGVAFFEKSIHIIHEIECVCQDFNHTLGFNQNVYSSGPLVTLVLYWYKEYSEIAVVLNVSSTKCQVITIDPCVASYYCDPCTKRHSKELLCNKYLPCDFFCKGGDPSVSCQKYLNQITQFTSVRLHTNDNKQYGKDVDYFFSMPYGTCFVLQLRKLLLPTSTSSAVNDIIKCKFGLIPAPVLSGEASFGFMITGKLDSEISDGDDFVFRSSPFLVRSFFPYSYFHEDNSYCIKERNGNITECDNVIHASPLGYTSFLMLSESKSYISTSTVFSMKIIHETMPSSQDWIDIIVWKTKMKEKHHILEFIHLSPGFNFVYLTKVSDRLEDVLYITALGVHAEELIRQYYSQIEFRFIDHYSDSGSFHWISEVKLFQKGHAFSLPVQINEVLIISDLDLPRIITIKVVWLSNNYRKISKHSNMCRHLPYGTTTSLKCFNFSQSGLKRKYLYFQESYPEKSKDISKINNFKDLLSWTEASDLCMEAGGYLPHFSSRNELDELISLMKLSKDITPQEAIYVGLNFKNIEKVDWLFVNLRKLNGILQPCSIRIQKSKINREYQ